MDAAHAAGATFTLMSTNLPYDAARYQGADAILLAYMSSGLGMDPTERGTAGTAGAYNANVVCALEMLFDATQPQGTLPVEIPAVVVADDGTVGYSNEVLYKRGSGLTSFGYAFVEGMGGVHEVGAASGLSFKANARHDKLVSVLVDETALAESDYTVAAGSTIIGLNAGYLDKLAAGEHQLSAVYDYGDGRFSVSTTFTVKAKPVSSNTQDGASSTAAQKAASSTTTQKAALAKTGDAIPLAAVTAIAAIAIIAAIALAAAALALARCGRRA